MKKLIISALAAAALLFGFASCSGDLHDTPVEDTTILRDAGIIGTINNWSAEKMTKVNDTTYTYSFTATDSTAQFSVQETLGDWKTRWCGNNEKGVPEAPETTKCTPGGELQPMVYSSEADPTHVQLNGLSANSEYKITVVIVEPSTKSISCKVELTKAGIINENAGPLDNYLLRGDFDSFGDGIQLTRIGESNTYTVDLEATATEQALKITTATWSPAYCVDDSAAVISMDLSESDVKWYKGDSGMDNPKVSGLTVGTTYTFTIVCSDDKSYVTVNIAEKQ